ncbi:MAG: hypothetical protein E3J72_07570 [Planctomycetota bacterium]|nr:MAG: hypothetical protein E3J72_07570 [Planctomycetota bacterium]
MKRTAIIIILIALFALASIMPGCGSSHKSSRGGSSGGGGTGSGGGAGGTGTGGGNGGGTSGAGQPPFGESSGGSGGSGAGNGLTTSSGVTYNLIVPGSYSDNSPNELLIVYSGTEGAAMMTQNLQSAGSQYIGSFICAVLDGVTYRGNGQAGADVLDEVRSNYNIDNDKTCLLGESAGTTAALQLGFKLKQSYFAAYWANDVNASDTPGQTASELGFEPWGNAGPGGAFAHAEAIVDGMRNAGYRLPADAPYSGPGAGSHGDPQQFFAALQFFPGKSRQ